MDFVEIDEARNEDEFHSKKTKHNMVQGIIVKITVLGSGEPVQRL